MKQPLTSDEMRTKVDYGVISPNESLPPDWLDKLLREITFEGDYVTADHLAQLIEMGLIVAYDIGSETLEVYPVGAE